MNVTQAKKRKIVSLTCLPSYYVGGSEISRQSVFNSSLTTPPGIKRDVYDVMSYLQHTHTFLISYRKTWDTYDLFWNQIFLVKILISFFVFLLFLAYNNFFLAVNSTYKVTYLHGLWHIISFSKLKFYMKSSRLYSYYCTF